MGNLERRIDDLEKRGIHIEWLTPQQDDAQLAARVRDWIASGGPLRAIQEHDPVGMRILELLQIAEKRHRCIMPLLERRIEKLEDQAPDLMPTEAEDMTDTELLALVPQSVKDVLAKMSYEDLDAMIEGRENELTTEGRALVEEINRLLDEQSSDPH